MLLNEILRMAVNALRVNKLRSSLTMLGVAIGVFSVIGVMTALSAIQGSIETGLSFLGSNIFQFAKYPVISKNDPDEQYANRRNIDLAQGNDYKKRMEGVAAASAWWARTSRRSSSPARRPSGRRSRSATGRTASSA